jgi:hypothetical protein
MIPEMMTEIHTKGKGLVDGVSWFVFQIVHNYYDVEMSVWIIVPDCQD